MPANTASQQLLQLMSCRKASLPVHQCWRGMHWQGNPTAICCETCCQNLSGVLVILDHSSLAVKSHGEGLTASERRSNSSALDPATAVATPFLRSGSTWLIYWQIQNRLVSLPVVPAACCSSQAAEVTKEDIADILSVQHNNPLLLSPHISSVICSCVDASALCSASPAFSVATNPSTWEACMTSHPG